MLQRVHDWLNNSRDTTRENAAVRAMMPLRDDTSDVRTTPVTSAVFSRAWLQGENLQEVQNLDIQTTQLYDGGKGNASDSFLKSFVQAQCTAAATILDLTRIRSNFSPPEGKDTNDAFNAFLKNLGACPFFTFNTTQQINNSFKVTRIADVATTIATICNCTSEQFERQGITDRVESLLPTADGETTRFDIYIMRIVAGKNITFPVNAGVVEVARKQEVEQVKNEGETKKKVYVTVYTISFRGFNLSYSFRSDTWDMQWAAKVAAQHYSSIENWQEKLDN